ncbi:MULTISPECIES: hypothetical protein [unclassified Streptomyces]
MRNLISAAGILVMAIAALSMQNFHQENHRQVQAASSASGDSAWG